MRIGFESKKIFKNFTGLGNYAKTLVQNYAQQYVNEDLTLYSTHNNNRNKNWLNQLSNVKLFVSESRPKWYWRSRGIINQLKKDQIDIFHGTSNELPVGIHKSGIKSVVTIHDLIFKIYPHTYNFFDRLIYNFKFKYACNKSDKIIAISKQTKADIVKLYGVNENKIEVIYQSCNPIFFNEEILSKDLIGQYNLPTKYMLYVGTVNERKNLKQIINAMSKIQADNRLPLVVVGSGGRYKSECEKLIGELGLNDYVQVITNLIDVSELKCVYQHAEMFIYPSVYEGFGIPVLEAMLCKTPIITSTISSLPEVTGGHAIHVNPNSADEIATAMNTLTTDDNSKNELIQNAYEYARMNYDAATTSKQLHDFYQRLKNE